MSAKSRYAVITVVRTETCCLLGADGKSSVFCWWCKSFWCSARWTW